MVEQGNALKSELSAFFSESDAFEKLVTIAAMTKPDDQEYVADQVLGPLKKGDYGRLNALIASRSEGEDFEDAAKHILTNRNVAPIDVGQTSDSFQDMYMRLKELQKQEGGEFLAKGALFYAVSTAYIEFQLEHKHGGTAYDPDVDGPITFATTSHTLDDTLG